MILTTLDLYHIDRCSLRWSKDPPPEIGTDPTRELVKRVFLMKALGRETGWSFPGIANLWDEIFWHGREVTRDNVRESVHGVLAARQLYKKLPQGEELEPYSAQNLRTSIGGIELVSSGDFMLSYPSRYEVWMYLDSVPKDIRRSPLAAVENFLASQAIRAAHQKPFYLVIYYTKTSRRKAGYFRIKSMYSEEKCRSIAFNLVERARKELYFPTSGTHCDDCKVNC